MKRRSLEDVVQSLKEKNLTLVSEYVSNKQKIVVKCDVGHIQTSLINNILNGTGCYTCYKDNKSTQQDTKIKQIVESSGVKFIRIVDRSDSTVEVTCKNDHTTIRNFYDIKNNHECKYCVGNRMCKTEVEDTVNAVGFTLVGFKDGLIIVRCKNGHNRKMAYVSFREGRRCGICGKNAKKTTEQVKNAVNVDGYSLEDFSNYKNTKSTLQVKCPRGHIFSTNYNRFVVNKQRCATCNIFRQEELCRSILQNLTGKLFLKCRPEFLRNPNTNRKLELDGYNPDLKLAFEYNGEWHYKELIKNRDVVDQQSRDSLKVQLCKDAGIKLIVIPYFIKDFKAFIEEQIKVNSGDKNEN